MLTMRKAARGKTKRRRWWWFAVGLFTLLLVDYVAFPHFVKPTTPSGNHGENGLWLRYTWYFGQQTDYAGLAHHLHTEQTRYAYFHVRDVQKNGMLRHRYPDKAQALTNSLHQRVPDVKLIAWVYVGNTAGRGNVDLAKPEVRQALVKEAVWLVTACGFDGIQWDYEICPSGDANFLLLLRETRTALPHGKLLCAAVPLWEPVPVDCFGWTERDFGAVSALCDQIAVMCYDSGIYLPRGYVWLLHQQVVHVTKAVARRNPRCRVLFGIPTYGRGGLAHHAPAENIRMALVGVRDGLADPQTVPSVAAGVAPFADYTTQEDEWQVYQEWWCRP